MMETMANGYEAFFKGKRITLMGLGLLGRGIGDAKFLATMGAKLTITDLKTETELASPLQELAAFPDITYHLGGHQMADFEQCDMVIRAPNAPLDSPYVAAARRAGIPVEMDASLFAKLTPATIIGITGTRGKSTTTHFIYTILRQDGRTVHLGGNERNTATLPLLQKAAPDDLVVLELDSWQLQGFEESRISPHVAVFTNFMPDHMNYYHGDMDRYFQDKAAIARFQRSGDYLITTPEIKERLEAQFGKLKSTCITNISLPDDWIVGIPGAHNRANAALAGAAARTFGVSDEVIKKTLQEFHALPGRLEKITEKHGIIFYNDSNSTTPDAAIAAITTLKASGSPIILIAGGNDKKLDFKNLAALITNSIKHLVLFEGAASEKLKALLPVEFPITMVKTMNDALEVAMHHAGTGDTVLLSPAATSFGIFKNEYDRGDQFNEILLKK